MTLQRLRNELRCRYSYLLSLFGINSVRHMPTFVSIEPANYCSLRCPECPVGMANSRHGNRRKPQLMSWDTFCKTIDAVSAEAHTVIFHFQGEPLLHPHLAGMIAYAHRKRLFTMLSTNGQEMTENLAKTLRQAGLDRIIVSIDGLSEQSYNAYRVGGSLHKALDALRFAQKAGIPERIMQCLKLSTNEQEWPLFRQQYRALGATRLELKTAQLYDYRNGHPLLPSRARDARYIKGKDGLFHVKKRLHNHCFRLWSGCVVTVEGNVLPCCFDKQADHLFGNLDKRAFRDIWLGKTAAAFRHQVLHRRRTIPICTNCTE